MDFLKMFCKILIEFHDYMIYKHTKWKTNAQIIEFHDYMIYKHTKWKTNAQNFSINR